MREKGRYTYGPSYAEQRQRQRDALVRNRERIHEQIMEDRQKEENMRTTYGETFGNISIAYAQKDEYGEGKVWVGNEILSWKKIEPVFVTEFVKTLENPEQAEKTQEERIVWAKNLFQAIDDLKS